MYSLRSINPIVLVLVMIPVLTATGCQSSTTRHVGHDHEAGPNAHVHNVQASVGYLSDQTPVQAPSVKLTVHGLGCPLCAGNIDRQLLRVPGVKNVTVNLKDGIATVEVSPAAPPTKAQLAKAVYESGFTLVKIE